MVHDSRFADDIGPDIYDFQPSPFERKILDSGSHEIAPECALAEAIGAQPVFSVRVLKLASFISGLPRNPSTVAQSIGILGADYVQALALGLWAFSLPLSRNEHEDSGTPFLRPVWEHSLGCAVVAERFAVRLGLIPAQSAFLAGFLHDIGRILLYHASLRHFIESLELATEKRIPLTEAEILAAGIDHLGLADLWARKIQLDSTTRAAIQYHHTPVCLLPDSMGAELCHIIRIVRLADLVCEAQRIGRGGEYAEPATDLWKALKLRPEDWAAEFRLVNQKIISARESFGFAKAESSADGWPPTAGAMIGHRAAAPRMPKPGGHRPGEKAVSFSARKLDSAAEGPGHASKRLTILVVEDHGSLCEMLSLYLIRHGYHVRTADNGQTALDVIAKEEIDVVLLDLMLPRVDGFSVLKHVRENCERQKPYVIVVSAGSSERDRNRVLELGANEYMPKPFHLTRLLERIQAVEKYLLG